MADKEKSATRYQRRQRGLGCVGRPAHHAFAEKGAAEREALLADFGDKLINRASLTWRAMSEAERAEDDGDRGPPGDGR